MKFGRRCVLVRELLARSAFSWTWNAAERRESGPFAIATVIFASILLLLGKQSAESRANRAHDKPRQMCVFPRFIILT